MPTAVCSGRVTEPVAMIETYLFKLEPWDMTISVGLHSHTTSISISHTLSQTQLHWANPPSTSTHPHKAARKLAHFLYLIQTSVVFALVPHLPSTPVPFILHTIWPQDVTMALDGVKTAPGLKSLRRVIPQEQHPLSDEDPNVSYSACPLLYAC